MTLPPVYNASTVAVSNRETNVTPALSLSNTVLSG